MSPYLFSEGTTSSAKMHT